jgi:hypothetical protein
MWSFFFRGDLKRMIKLRTPVRIMEYTFFTELENVYFLITSRKKQKYGFVKNINTDTREYLL